LTRAVSSAETVARFSVELLAELVRAGLATARAERVVADKPEIEVPRVRITGRDSRC
jgi:hypothetical protein